MRVMIVDDSPSMRKIQRSSLEELAITDIVEAEDGKDAVAKLEGEAVDVIMLDWNMPNLNGIETLKAIRANPGTQDIKVIMCTTEAEKGKILDAVKAGANGYIVKPFTSNVLKEKLDNLGSMGF